MVPHVVEISPKAEPNLLQKTSRMMRDNRARKSTTEEASTVDEFHELASIEIIFDTWASLAESIACIGPIFRVIT